MCQRRQLLGMKKPGLAFQRLQNSRLSGLSWQEGGMCWRTMREGGWWAGGAGRAVSVARAPGLVRETGLGITLSRKGDREDRKVHSGFYSQISCLCAWPLESGNFSAMVVTGRGAWEDASPRSKRAAGFASAAGGTPESPSLSDPRVRSRVFPRPRGGSPFTTSNTYPTLN